MVVMPLSADVMRGRVKLLAEKRRADAEWRGLGLAEKRGRGIACCRRSGLVSFDGSATLAASVGAAPTSFGS